MGVTDWIDFQHTTHPARGLLVDAPYIDHLPLEEKSIAATLKENGYATWHVGKWHLGGEQFYPEKHGFDINIGGCECGAPVHGFFSPWKIPTIEENYKGEYLQDRLTDEAISLIEKNENQPFFLNLWYYSVHIPIEAKEEHIEIYKRKAREMGIDTIDPFEEGGFFSTEHKRDKRIQRRKIQSDPVYAAMVFSLDQNIGRLLNAVREKGIEKDTVIFFTSDNGGLSTAEGSPTSNAPLSEGKGWMYEGGTREPLIVKWPGKVLGGSRCFLPVTSPDFYPTILEIAALPPQPNQHRDGESLTPILTGKTDSLNREAIFWHYPHYGNQGGRPGASLRRGKYKLIYFFEDEHFELYDLDEDVGEEHNLLAAPNKTVHHHAEEMKKMLFEWFDQVDAKFPAPG